MKPWLRIQTKIQSISREFQEDCLVWNGDKKRLEWHFQHKFQRCGTVCLQIMQKLHRSLPVSIVFHSHPHLLLPPHWNARTMQVFTKPPEGTFKNKTRHAHTLSYILSRLPLCSGKKTKQNCFFMTYNYLEDSSFCSSCCLFSIHNGFFCFPDMRNPFFLLGLWTHPLWNDPSWFFYSWSTVILQVWVWMVPSQGSFWQPYLNWLLVTVHSHFVFNSYGLTSAVFV